MGCGVWGVGFVVWGLRLGFWGLGFGVWGVGVGIVGCGLCVVGSVMGIGYTLLSQNVLLDLLQKVNSPKKSSICCLLLLIRRFTRRFCGRVGCLKPMNKYTVPDKLGTVLELRTANSQKCEAVPRRARS